MKKNPMFWKLTSLKRKRKRQSHAHEVEPNKTERGCGTGFEWVSLAAWATKQDIFCITFLAIVYLIVYPIFPHLLPIFSPSYPLVYYIVQRIGPYWERDTFPFCKQNCCVQGWASNAFSGSQGWLGGVTRGGLDKGGNACSALGTVPESRGLDEIYYVL